MEFTDLKGKIAIVTGASEGIGKAITDQLVREGARVICIARTQSKLDALMQQHGDKIHAVTMDVADQSAVMALPDKLPAEWRNVSILVNNAGITGPGKEFAEMSPSDLSGVVNTNLLGTATMCRAFLPSIQKNKGHIVNIGSIAGDLAYTAGHIYAASKAGIEALSNNIRVENLRYGVRVTHINPGKTFTDIQRKRFAATNPELAEKLSNDPNQLNPADVAGATTYCLKQPPGASIDELTINPTAALFGRGVELQR